VTLVGALPCVIAIDSQLHRSGGGRVGGHNEEVEPEDTPVARCWLRRRKRCQGYTRWG
jgi:hypothetical protein